MYFSAYAKTESLTHRLILFISNSSVLLKLAKDGNKNIQLYRRGHLKDKMEMLQILMLIIMYRET